MPFQEKTFKASDGKNVTYYYWPAANGSTAKATVQLAHGMAEHAARYDRFASFLAKNGYAVFANDHRGHGKTAGGAEQLGYTEEGSFWDKALADMRSLHGIAKKQHPGLPHFLFGHSMGSFLTRHYIAEYGNEVSGAILSGTAGDPGFLGKVGAFIANMESIFKGRKKQSKLLNLLSFGKFNEPFKPNRTAYDWLSRDEAEVDKYVEDPLCGTVFTTGFFIDLLKGIGLINNKNTFEKTPKDLPIYLFAGAKDPVGDMGKGVTEVFNAYKKAGLKKVLHKLYEEGRHEMLNEVNWEEVFGDVLEWLEEAV
ncbi:MAG TPA: alpha/beta hydrolase [Bacteroidetes bacterium]|nr:alpha/beta hydrolase [Bacteroidota bacterium]